MTLPHRLLLAALLSAPAAGQTTFVENHGQWAGADRARAPFVAWGERWTAVLERDALQLSLRSEDDRLATLRLVFEGANEHVELVGEGDSTPRTWIRPEGTVHADAHERVRYRSLWPGIDLVLRDVATGLEYDLVLAPGATLERVAIRCEGAAALTLEPGGTLRIDTPLGPLRQSAPTTWAVSDAGPEPVACRFVRLAGEARFGFESGARDPRLPLVVDPTLEWATYFGGASTDASNALAVDALGRVIVCGTTNSPNFPATAGSYDGTPPTEHDAFVACLDPTQSGPAQLVWSTFLGGSAYDEALAVDVGANGEITLTGSTFSADLPATAGAFETSYAGAGDGFVARLSADGTSLAYLSYFGGGGEDLLYAAELDATGRVVATGWTSSADLPTTPGAYDTSLGGTYDALVVRLAPAGAGQADLEYATYYGGSSDDYGYDVTVDCAGDAHLTGETASSDFPATPGAFDTLGPASTSDGFYAHVRPAGAGGADLVYGTLLGGAKQDWGSGIDLDSEGRVHVVGSTRSDDFPVTAGAFDPTPGTNRSGWFARLRARGAGAADLQYGSHLHGDGTNDVFRAKVLESGDLFLCGTSEGGLPLTPDAAQSFYAGGDDAYVAIVSLDGAGRRDLLYCSYWGGAAGESSFAAVLDGALAYTSGRSKSVDFPTSPGAYADTKAGGSQDGMLTGWKLGADGPSSYCVGKPDSLGGTPALGWIGSPSVGGADDFHVLVRGVQAGQYALVVYGTAPDSGSWFGGTQCVAFPIRRGRAMRADCSGVTFDHLSHSDLATFGFSAGTTVYAQALVRDPGLGAPDPVALSAALAFTITP